MYSLDKEYAEAVSAQNEVGAAGSGSLTPSELASIDAYWRAANYLSVGQIYLLDTSSRGCLAIGERLRG